MPRFLACRAQVHYDDGRPSLEDDDVEVDLDGGVLVFCYWDDQGAVVFEGREEAPGRFTARARSRPCVARLARSPGTGVLEGTWAQGDDTGRIRIELSEEVQPR